MKFNMYKILFFFFFILLRCDRSYDYVVTNDLISVETNQVIELKSIYFQNNIDNISHLDSLSFSWTSDKLLENKFNLKPFGDFGEKAYLTPINEGFFEINLIVKHRWTGKQLNYENFIFEVTSSNENKYNNVENNISENKSINEIKVDKKAKIYEPSKPDEKIHENIFFIQFGAFKSKQKALLELNNIEKYLSNLFIIEEESLFKIRSGPYDTFSQAKSISESLNKDLRHESWIIQNFIFDNLKLDSESKIINIEVENLISYEDEVQSKPIEVENLISYEDEVQSKPIEVENLISYEDEIAKTEKSYIQIGTWKNKNQAIEYFDTIKSLGFEPFIEEVIGPNDQVWNKVLIGPFNKEKADIFQKEISKNINRRVRIIK